MKEYEARINISSLFKDKKILSVNHVQGIIFHEKRPAQEQYFYEGVLNKLIVKGLIIVVIKNNKSYYQWIDKKNKRSEFKKNKKDNSKIERKW